MPNRHSQPRGDLDLAISFFQVDRSWYEDYWLKEREPRRRVVTRSLAMIVSCVHRAYDRMTSVRRAVLAIILRPNVGIQSWNLNMARRNRRELM